MSSPLDKTSKSRPTLHRVRKYKPPSWPELQASHPGTGHTQDSICFFVEDKAKNQRGVFTGDTLFVGGCGRFFEGKPEEMHTALNKTLASLPDDTIVYCGHEYTKDNVKFGAHIAPDNEAVQKLKDFADKNSVTTGIFTIGDEKKHNVFMSPNITAEKVGELREQKNNFRGWSEELGAALYGIGIHA